MMRLLLASAACVVGMAAAGAASAQAGPSPWAGTAGIGVDGIGVGVLYRVSPHIVLSGRASYFGRYKDDGDSFGFHVNGKTNLGGITGAVEFHPWTVGSEWMTPAFVSAGFFHGYDRDVKLTGYYTGTPIQVGPVSVGGGQIGGLSGKGTVDDTIPVIGIGWDNTFTTTSRWGYRFFGGVGFGDAKVTSLAASGGVYSNNPNVTSTVAAVAQGVQKSDQFDILRTYPVVSASVTYKF